MSPLSLKVLPDTRADLKVGRSPKVSEESPPYPVTPCRTTPPSTEYSFAEILHKAQLMLANTFVSRTISSGYLHTSTRLVVAR